jgi:hypothetical protein
MKTKQNFRSIEVVCLNETNTLPVRIKFQEYMYSQIKDRVVLSYSALYDIVTRQFPHEEFRHYSELAYRYMKMKNFSIVGAGFGKEYNILCDNFGDKYIELDTLKIN